MKNTRRILNPLSPQAAGRATVAALGVVVLLCTWLEPQTARANPPSLMAYQGYVVDASGTALATNTPRNFDVIFRIYPLQQGGASVWAEQQTVTVDKGYFSVLLGQGAKVGTEPGPGPNSAISSVFAHGPTDLRFIGITVKITGQTDLEIAPRLQLITSPYAFMATKAMSASSVDGGAVTSGTVPDVRLSPNVALLNLAQTFTAIPTFGSGLRFNSSIQSIGGNARGGNSVDLQTERNGVNSSVASGPYSVIVGGANNTASGYGSTVDGGFNNTTAGTFSHAAGYRAKANHDGSFVWADWQEADFASTAPNQFLIRAAGGVGIGTTTPSAQLDVTANARVRGTIRTGSEAGTSQAPNPAGLVIRRVNSTVSTAGQIVARTDLLTLERDGSISGLRIRYPANVNKQTVMVRYMNGDNNSYSYYTRLDSSLVGAAAGTYPLSSLFPGNVIDWEITFGDMTYSGSAHYTQVHLTRYYADVDVATTPAVRYWVGTLTSTFDQ